MQTEHDTAMDAAKIQLISRPDSVFITTILFSLRFSWDDTIPTACTNGVHLRVSPQFFMGLSKEERIFLLAHEAYHVAFQHMTRVGDRNFRLWNIATDYVINDTLIQTGMTMPKGGLHDEAYRGMTSDEVYALLENEREEDLPDCPDDMEQVEGDAETVQGVADEVAATVIKAAMRAKTEDQWGTVPGEVEIFLDSMVKPKLPWHRILNNVFSEMAQTDYSFRRPSRRFFPEYHLPSMYADSLGEIAVAVDISGSITQPQFDQFISEIHQIHKRLQPKRTRVISFDTRVANEYTITEAKDILGLKFTGGGGTCIEPVFDWVEQNKPKTLVVFTDGCFDLPQHRIPGGIPVFWIIEGNYPFKPRKGKVIPFE
ncbi:hypothetical protein IT774_07490 [Salinimonas marina]|uniref:Metallopeptidase domain-containing protein n=1 Tax=Salinimonas marina TaxID=2785918 RepID=A0A7S9HEJ0_9ALTE|nr:VWA-like domain-containing protein [Salinimonas marina]QPG06937.1 hypothetical protein IT774_07490 [Salinimonas marina]